MPLDMINPGGLVTPAVYSQVVVATGGRIVFVAGQVAWDAQGNVVGTGDMAAQARQAYRNVRIAVLAAGGTVADVAKLTTFVVGYRPELRGVIAEARAEVFGDHRPASTLVGVLALALPELLIEVEALAVVA
jgi:enamine deaminase RidA (YjgF/YER057c/UK114 family)